MTKILKDIQNGNSISMYTNIIYKGNDRVKLS